MIRWLKPWFHGTDRGGGVVVGVVVGCGRFILVRLRGAKGVF